MTSDQGSLRMFVNGKRYTLPADIYCNKKYPTCRTCKCKFVPIENSRTCFRCSFKEGNIAKKKEIVLPTPPQIAPKKPIVLRPPRQKSSESVWSLSKKKPKKYPRATQEEIDAVFRKLAKPS